MFIYVQVDQIMFKRPVDIGDLVRLKSRVTFSGSTSTSTSSASGASDKVESAVCVEVNCQVIRPEK